MGMSTIMFFFIFLLDRYEQYYVLHVLAWWVWAILHSFFFMFPHVFFLSAFVRFGDDICSTVQHMIVLCSTSALHALLQCAPIVPFWLRYVMVFFLFPFHHPQLLFLSSLLPSFLSDAKCNTMQFFLSFFLDKPQLKWSRVYVFSSLAWIRTTAITLLRSWVWHMGVAGRKSVVKLQVYDGDAKYGAIDWSFCFQNSTTF